MMCAVLLIHPLAVPREPHGQPIGSHHFVQAGNMVASRQSSGVREPGPGQIGQGAGVRGLRSEGGRI